ncbi:MAG TPA: DUF2490 domain-containing protein [Ohtaekwangia sp.]|nr:DUF2490 domain-containing protein [Ohtaekwangia sp.]
MTFKRRTVLAAVLFLTGILIPGMSQSVSKHIHSREQLWFAYFNQTRLSAKLGLWMDIHYRQTDHFTDRPFQFLFRPAITYFIKDNFRVNVGYALVEHFPGRGLSTTRPEHRAWQQLWWQQRYTGLATLQWIRLEERFNRKITNDVLQPGHHFNYRLRYNLTFLVPLKGKEIKAGTPFLSVIDELFVNFGKRIVYNTFDQNRFFAGMGYQFDAHKSVQLGYMNIFQQESTGTDYVSTHAVRLFFFHSIDLRKSDDDQGATVPGR